MPPRKRGKASSTSLLDLHGSLLALVLARASITQIAAVCIASRRFNDVIGKGARDGEFWTLWRDAQRVRDVLDYDPLEWEFLYHVREGHYRHVQYGLYMGCMTARFSSFFCTEAAENRQYGVVSLLLRESTPDDDIPWATILDSVCDVEPPALPHLLVHVRAVIEHYRSIVDDCYDAAPSILCAACAYGWYDLCEWVLSITRPDGALVLRGADAAGALLFAAHYGHVDVASRLLQMDGLFVVGGDSAVVLCGAAINGHVGIVDLLLSHMIGQRTYLDFAIREQCIDALIAACRSGHAAVARRFVYHYAITPDARENQAIIEASAWGHVDVVRLLARDWRVNVHAQSDQAFRVAGCQSSMGDIDVDRMAEAYEYYKNDQSV